jgi:(p)ppGpp synthase/HD superfamily hydrolase
MPKTLTTAQVSTLSKIAHHGQTYGGGDYWANHVKRVVEDKTLNTETLRQIAWLHDVVEDTSMTLTDLSHLGVAGEVLENVAWLTRTKGEPYADYIRNLVSNAPYKAALVKMADLRVNLAQSERELKAYDGNDRYLRRVEKYSLALLAFEVMVHGFGPLDDD